MKTKYETVEGREKKGGTNAETKSGSIFLLFRLEVANEERLEFLFTHAETSLERLNFKSQSLEKTSGRCGASTNCVSSEFQIVNEIAVIWKSSGRSTSMETRQFSPLCRYRIAFATSQLTFSNCLVHKATYLFSLCCLFIVSAIYDL